MDSTVRKIVEDEQERDEVGDHAQEDDRVSAPAVRVVA